MPFVQRTMEEGFFYCFEERASKVGENFQISSSLAKMGKYVNDNFLVLLEYRSKQVTAQAAKHRKLASGQLIFYAILFTLATCSAHIVNSLKLINFKNIFIIVYNIMNKINLKHQEHLKNNPCKS